MTGQILDYSVQTNSGIISGDDYQRYTFRGAEWMHSQPPSRGMRVDFVVVGSEATRIYAAIGRGAAAGYSNKKIAAGLLAILLGWLGIHKFYLGYKEPGIILLLCGTVGWFLLMIPGIVAVIIGIIEGIIYLSKSDEQFEMEYVSRSKNWF